ncbi:MAG: sel1 repeat family protein [Rhodobacteraceae bacterium]|nr:sel1 repeat family protein [Paracoccaceae bacterium]
MLASCRFATRPGRGLRAMLRRHALVAGLALLAAAVAPPVSARIVALPEDGGAPAGPALLGLGIALPSPEAEGVSYYAIAQLPALEEVSELVTATLLQSRTVSTIVTHGEAESGLSPRGQLAGLSLETAFTLQPGEDPEALSLRLGEESLPAADFAARLAALSEGFGPARQGFALAVVADPQGVFPGRIETLRRMLAETGFPMWVLLMTGEATGSDCAPALGRHVALSLLGGVADRPAFGNADGQTGFAEAESFARRILTDGFARADSCAGAYAVVLDNGADPVLVHDSPVYIPAQQEALTVEEFEAEFLTSSDAPAPIRAYLESCHFCPAAEQLEARLTEIDRRAALARIEDKVWTRISEAGPDADRLAVYLERCTLCAHRDEAEATLARLQAAARAIEEENRRFAELSGQRDLEGLRAYVEGCEACTYRETALARIEEIEADADYARELSALEEAISAGDPEGIRGWIAACRYCDALPRAETALQRQEQRAALAGPCLAAAAVPQLGGPRLLGQIDLDAARAACGALLAEFPEDPEALTLQGRIAQAAGDFAGARSGYEAGMRAGVPMAFGMAGYMAYDAPEAGEPDFARAETLGLQGAEAGDWISHQLLVLLYSQNLRPGKGMEDALALAEPPARAGDPVSQYFYGYFLLTGNGPSGRPDPEAARSWLGRSVDAGYVPAMPLLAEALETAVASEPEAAEAAARLYLRALRAGNSQARDKLTVQLRERNRAVVRAVQAVLQQEGIYRGGLDGLPGPGTITAVQTYGASESAG